MQRLLVFCGRGMAGGAAAAPPSGGRSPLITFPQRRDSNGQPLVRLSLDHVTLSPTPSSVPAAAPLTETPLPTTFGRLPLTTAEMECINSGGAR